jgi:hypothetical protein
MGTRSPCVRYAFTTIRMYCRPIAKGSGASVDFVLLDLASLPSVRTAAEQLLALHPRLDVLLCNAGMLSRRTSADALELTKDGFEATLQVRTGRPSEPSGARLCRPTPCRAVQCFAAQCPRIAGGSCRQPVDMPLLLGAAAAAAAAIAGEPSGSLSARPSATACAARKSRSPRGGGVLGAAPESHSRRHHPLHIPQWH